MLFNTRQPATSMRYNIYLRFDTATEHTLQQIRRKLADDTPGVPSVKGKMPAHITLSVFDCDDTAQVAEQFAKLDPGSAFLVPLGEVAAFEKASPVIYVEPERVAPLEALHQRVMAICEPFTLQPHCESEEWQPHITLAKRIKPGHGEEAREMADQLWHPRDALACSVEYVALPEPRHILGAYTLLFEEPVAQQG